MAPTNVSGGYVTAFIADPDDAVGTSSNAIARIISQHGAKVTKAWESCSVSSGPPKDLLYTSVSGHGDPRLYSPGQFVLGIDSKVVSPMNQPVPVSVYADWSVELSVPSLEEDEERRTELISNRAFYCRAGHPGLWFDQGGPTGEVPMDDPRTAIPGIQFDQIYELDAPFYCEFTTLGGNFWEVMLINDKDHGITLAPVDPSTNKPLVEVAKNDESKLWVWRSGTRLVLSNKGNLQVGSEFLSLPSRSDPFSKPEQKILSPCLNGLDRQMGCSKNSSKQLETSGSSNQDYTALKAQLRSMESQLRLLGNFSSNESIEVLGTA